MEFQSFPKIPRYSRDIIITEKLDGTNAQIYIEQYTDILDENNLPYGNPLCTYKDMAIFAGSRNRWITIEDDNFGFAKWVKENSEELVKLGPGRHFGEWWGKGIQRGYGLDHKRFSLFNVQRWNIQNIPECCSVVPTLYHGPWNMGEACSNKDAIEYAIELLKSEGSLAAPGFMDPEGIIIYHTGKVNGVLFKKTIKNDEKRKGEV